MAKQAKKTNDKDDGLDEDQRMLKSYMDQNKELHYNNIVERYYQVSSGSLTLDYSLNGGFGPGLHRFTGISGAGKTNAGLDLMNCF